MRGTRLYDVLQDMPLSSSSDVDAASRVTKWLAALEFDAYRPHEALHMTKALAEVVAAQAALGRCGVRIEATSAHNEVGARDAEGFLAATAGVSRPDARALLNAAKVLDNTESAGPKLRMGKLSGPKANEVANGVMARPEQERELVRLAENDSLLSIKDQARRASQSETREREIECRRRKNQCVKIYAGEDGMTKLFANLPPEIAKDVISALRQYDDVLFHKDRKAGIRREQPVRMVEALHNLVNDATTHRNGSCESGSKKSRRRSRHDALILVNLESLRRGQVEQGEVCEINGIGEISVETALHLLGESLFRIVIRDGVDLRCATSRSRHWKAVVKDLMDFREVRCGVRGCDAILGLERHHHVEFANGGETSLHNGVRLCHHHHDLITNRGFWLEEAGYGAWNLRRPGQFGFADDDVGGVADTG